MSGGRRERLEEAAASALERLGVDAVVAPERVVRLLEFGAVGLTGVAVNVAIFVWLTVFFHYVVAGTAAFFVALSWTFAVNRVVTFDRPDGRVPRQYLRYVGVGVAAFLVYMGTLAVTIDVVGLSYIPADVIAAGVGGLVNFAGSEVYAFDMLDGE